jgi:hypothetical protein
VFACGGTVKREKKKEVISTTEMLPFASSPEAVKVTWGQTESKLYNLSLYLPVSKGFSLPVKPYLPCRVVVRIK